MNQRSLHFYEFGPFRLNVTERLLQRGSEIVPLTPKVFDTLLVLVENNGHIVEKNELIQQLWPDSFVEESSLTQNISLLRRALSEVGSDNSYIETIPKRGYRFIAEVREQDELTNGNAVMTAIAEQAPQVPAKDPAPTVFPSGPLQTLTNANGYMAVILGCIMIAVLLMVAYWFRQRNTAENFAPRSVAVLPFKTIGANNENDLLGLGMADALIIKLSRLDQLTVLPTSSVFRYTNREKDAVAIGRDLDVEAVLDGTVQRDGDWVRVTAQLIRLKDGKTIWSGKFDERYSSIFTLQDSISEQLSVSLRPQVAQNGIKSKPAHPTENTEAYQAYLTGLYFWNRRTRENLPKAIDYLEQAVTRDPNFAEARAILADCYFLGALDEYGLSGREEGFNRASQAVTKALELDDTLAEAHTVQANLKQAGRQFEEAGNEFRRALELNPNYAVGHVRYAYFLYGELKLDAALSHMRRAQQLDPISPITNGALAGMLYAAHDFDGCIQYSKRALELEPGAFSARLNLGEAYVQKHMFNDAHAAFDKVRDENKRYVYWEKAYAYGLEGRREDALRSIAEAEKNTDSERRNHLNYATVYASLGDNDKAFAEMELMDVGRFIMATLKYDPCFDPIRGDPRYAEFLQRHRIQ
jgi:DNA-binding winged helix-turn-helix (wHTH) protein/TolB-like protein/Tfp pilus assembly protein PilF